MSRWSRNTPPAPPVVERNPSPVVFDPIPKEERRPEPVDMDVAIDREFKLELAVASMTMHVYRTRPRIFKMICIAIDVNYMEVYQWAEEVLRCRP